MRKFTNYLMKSMLAILAVVGFSTTANAQTIVWGAGSANTAHDTIGRFASSDGTLAGAGWTNVQILGGDWQYSTTGISAGSYGSSYGLHINSPTLTDGVAMFDSDFYYGQGIVPQNAILLSPAIDLTGYADSTLRIKAYCGLVEFASDSTDIMFTTGPGEPWIRVNAKDELNAGQNAVTEGWVFLDISPALQGATNLTAAQIAIQFKGDSYAFSVDDISIETFVPDPPAYDLGFVISNGPTYGDLQTSVFVGNTRYLPENQVEAGQFYFGARVGNEGDLDIPPSNNPMLTLNIERDNGGTWTSVYMDTIMIMDTLYSGVRDSLYAEDITDVSWATIGAYRTTYVLSHDSTDESSANDSLVQNFWITENDGYYSRVDLNNGNPSAPFSWSGGVDSTHVAWEWGTLFYFPTGTVAGDSVFIDTVTYGFNIATLGNQVFNIKIFEFDDANNDGFIEADGSELTLVGIGIDSITNFPTGFHFSQAQMIDINRGGIPRFMVEPGKVYLVAVGQGIQSGVNHGIGFQNVDYWMSTFYGNPALWPSPYNLQTSAGSDWDSYGPYFGSSIGGGVPAIGLQIGGNTIVSVDQLAADKFDVEVFPNPVQDQFNVSINLEQVTNVRYILTAVNGALINMVNSDNVMEEVQTFDISRLPAGVYTLSIITENGDIVNKRIVKQ